MPPGGDGVGGSTLPRARTWIEGHLERLPADLREHILRVREIALEVARRHGADEEKVWVAASLHDIARAMSDGELLAKARELNVPIGPLEEALPFLLHGPVAAELLRRQGLVDTEVYQAVYWHGIARPGMGVVEKVVFLADKLDPQKIDRYPYQVELKRVALEDLDRATLMFLERDMARLLDAGGLIHPSFLEARNELLLKAR